MAEEAAEAAPPPVVKKRKMSGKKLVLFIILPLLLFGGGGAAAWFLLFQGHEPVEGEVAEGEPEHPPIYFDLDEMTVNLSTTSKRSSYLKLKLALELGAELLLRAQKAASPATVKDVLFKVVQVQ